MRKATIKPIEYQKSETGMYAVELARAHEHGGFLYTPAMARITVDEAILDDMVKAGAVASVTPA